MSRKRRRSGQGAGDGGAKRRHRGGRSRKRTAATAEGLSRGLAWLMGGESAAEDFVAKTFEQEPFHVRRGPSIGREYYSALAELADLEGLLSLLEGGMDIGRVSAFRCKDGSTTETPKQPLTSAADVRSLFAEGWSLAWPQPQQEHDALAQLVSSLESEFGCLVGVTAYLTPPGAQGLAPHWDDADAFVLQLSGSKSWRLHRSTSASSESHTLARVGSGDIELGSLALAVMELDLKRGDLLYFPRGIIHHAPNTHASEPSVHLTISAFQRQSLFDLSSKALEEAMVEMWEEDEEMRRALPWGAASLGSPLYANMCVSVAGALRRLANKVEEEAHAAAAQPASASYACGFVGSALADLHADFVRRRLPPRPAAGPEHMHPVTPASTVVVVDPSALALVPDELSSGFVLVNCLFNPQSEHMMPQGEGPEVGDDAEESEGELVEEGHGGKDATDQEKDLDRESSRCPVSQAAAGAVIELCSSSASTRLAGPGGSKAKGEPLEALLRRAGTPRDAWPEVCSILEELALLGIVRVSPAEVRSQGRSPAQAAAQATAQPRLQPRPKPSLPSQGSGPAAGGGGGGRRRGQRGGRKRRDLPQLLWAPGPGKAGGGKAKDGQAVGEQRSPAKAGLVKAECKGVAARSSVSYWTAASRQKPFM